MTTRATFRYVTTDPKLGDLYGVDISVDGAHEDSAVGRWGECWRWAGDRYPGAVAVNQRGTIIGDLAWTPTPPGLGVNPCA